MKNKKMGPVILMVIVIAVSIFLGFLFVNKNENAYNVTFDIGNSAQSNVVKVQGKNSVSKPADPTKEGYEFEGWYYNGVEFDFTTTITEDITLTAMWTKLEDQEEPTVTVTYTVKFDANGGSVVKSQTVEQDKAVTEPTKPTRSGYTFAGWYNGSTKFNFATKITGNITLTAKWTKVEEEKETTSTNKTTTCTVKFNSNGGSTVKAQTIEKGKTAKEPTKPTRNGYTFNGWYNGSTKFNFNTKITGNITLTAKWTKIEEPVVETKKYTVTFDSKGGSTVSSKTVEEGKTVQKPSNPTRKDYTFKGWYLGETEYNFSTKVTGNITLTAKWEKIEEPVVETKKYTVTFDSKGGSTVSSKTVEEGKTVQKPGDPTRSGYTFKGWYLNGTKYTFTEKVTGNITLTAEWEKDDVITWGSEKVQGALFPQVRIFIYKNGTPVAGTADFVDSTGAVVRKNVPATGKIEPEGSVVNLKNITVN